MGGDGLGAASGVDTELDEAMSGGRSQTVGRFRFFVDHERWEWSPEVQQIHGYQPGSMPNPTTAQVLSHKHPDDLKHVVGALEDTRRTRAAFSTAHRIIDVQGRVRSVTLVGDQLRDEAGSVIGTHGFYIDVTPAERDYEDRISEAVSVVSEHRAVIEQAKGMLSLLYGVNSATAFELLRWRSQEANVKLRELAEQLVIDFRGLGGETLPGRDVYNRLVMTVEQRINAPRDSRN